MIESNIILVITVVFMVIFQNPIASAAEIVGSEDQFQGQSTSQATVLASSASSNPLKTQLTVSL